MSQVPNEVDPVDAKMVELNTAINDHFGYEQVFIEAITTRFRDIQRDLANCNAELQTINSKLVDLQKNQGTLTEDITKNHNIVLKKQADLINSLNETIRKLKDAPLAKEKQNDLLDRITLAKGKQDDLLDRFSPAGAPAAAPDPAAPAPVAPAPPAPVAPAPDAPVAGFVAKEAARLNGVRGGSRTRRKRSKRRTRRL